MRRFPVQLSRKEQLWAWGYWAFSELALVSLLRILVSLYPGIPPVLPDFILLAANFLFLTVILRKFLLDSLQFALERLWHILRSAFLAYGLYWLLSFGISFLCSRIMPEFENLNDNAIASLSGQQRTLTHIATVLLAPVTEELLYRGLLFGTVYDRRPWLGYLISVVVFSAAHVIGYIGLYSPLGMLVAFLQYLPAGFCLSWAYARSKCIYSPILMHIAINQLAMMLI